MPFDPLDKSSVLVTGDVEIGAVELKDAATDTRAKVGAATALVEGDNVVGVQAPVLGVTTGAALDADGPGTIQQYLRGQLKAFLARIPTDPAKESGILSTIAARLVSGATSAADLLLTIKNTLDIYNSKFTFTNGQVLAIGAASQLSAQLAAGKWRLSGNGDIWFIQGGNAITAVKNGANCAYLAAGAIETLIVDNITTEGYVAIIQDGSETGYMSLVQTK